MYYYALSLNRVNTDQIELFCFDIQIYVIKDSFMKF